MKYTVVLDFDGVIHSYSSGWRGKTCIPDPPVPGIREEIYKMRQIYRVVVVSTRCDTQDGMDAVKAYLKQNGIEVDAVMKEKPPAVVNCTPFVRQYGILSNKWGVLLCQREYRTNDTQRNSRSW